MASHPKTLARDPRHFHHGLLTALYLGVLLVAAAPAPGQEPPPATPVPPREGPEAGGGIVDRALAHLEAGRLAEAVTLLEPLRADPEAPPQALAVLGALYVEVGRPADALAVLEPLARPDDADPAVLYNAGRAALAVGRTAEADAYLERSAARAPGSPAARELGLLRGRQGRFEEAYVLLRPWVAQRPDDAEARLAAAFAALRLERAPAVEELLSDLPQSNPRVRFLWGQLLLLKGDPWGAVATLKPLIGNAPPEMDLDVRRALAEAYVITGEAASAVELLEGQVEGRPEAALELAMAQYQSGDAEGALATVRPFAERLVRAGDTTALGVGPALAARIALIQGRVLTHLGRGAEALPALELAARWAPDDKQVWQALGQALAAAGKTDEAKAALARFQELAQQETREPILEREEELEDPTGRAVREGFELLGRPDPRAALEVARREARLAPDDPRPHLLEGSALLRLDRPEEAVAAAERALALAPDNPDAIYLRGTTRMAVGNLEGAEADLRRALDVTPDHTAAINDLAVLLMERGDRAEARRLLERALELSPGDPVARENLERLDGP